MENVEKLGFVDRVLKALKQSDDSKIKRFHNKEIKWLKDQIKLREESILEAEESKSDKMEEYQEALLSVNLEAIKTTEGAKDYCNEYTNRMFGFKAGFQEIDEEIEQSKEEIKQYKSLIEDLA